jgi:hypothetical protein
MPYYLFFMCYYFFLAETNWKLLIKKSLRPYTSRIHVSWQKFFFIQLKLCMLYDMEGEILP